MLGENEGRPKGGEAFRDAVIRLQSFPLTVFRVIV